MIKVHVLISGIVQGVGYRSFIKENAGKLGIGGFVKNVKDGLVEAEFEGEEEKINELLELCKDGPELAIVDNIKEITKEIVDKPAANFQIK